MLTGLTLRNFKCFESVEIPLGRITVPIGPNGSGKSSVLHALALLRQSAGQRALNYAGPLIDLASYDDIVFRKDISRDIGIRYQSEPFDGSGRSSYTYEVLSHSHLKRLVYSFESDFGLNKTEWSIDGSPSMQVVFSHWNAIIEPQDVIGNNARVSSYSGGSIGDSFYMRLSAVLSEPERCMRSWRYTPVSKGFVRSSYQLLDEGIDEVRNDVEPTNVASGLATAIAYDDDLSFQLSSWMKEVTGLQIDTKVTNGRRIFVRTRRSGSKLSVPISHEGFGSSQLTYMLFLLARTPHGGLDMIEEPELHLHPYAIARLADLLAREAVESDKQVILTTHSEHLLLGLLNNVAEGKLAASDLVVLYTSLTEDGAKVERVQINDEGMAEGGLPGFFDATLEAQRRHLEALSRRA